MPNIPLRSFEELQRIFDEQTAAFAGVAAFLSQLGNLELAVSEEFLSELASICSESVPAAAPTTFALRA